MWNQAPQSLTAAEMRALPFGTLIKTTTGAWCWEKQVGLTDEWRAMNGKTKKSTDFSSSARWLVRLPARLPCPEID